MLKIKANTIIDLADKLFLQKIYCDEDVYTIEPITYANGYWFDKTACESSVNRILISELFEYNTIEELRDCGIIIAQIWESRLKAEYPDKSFMIFLTVDEGEEDHLISSTLRFCLKGDNEPAWSDSVTDYKSFFVWRT